MAVSSRQLNAIAATGRTDTVAFLMKECLRSAAVCAAPAAAFPVEKQFDLSSCDAPLRRARTKRMLDVLGKHAFGSTVNLGARTKRSLLGEAGIIGIRVSCERAPDPFMSWRSGSKLSSEMWPLIQANIPDKQHRIEFTARVLKQMVRDDMDPFDVEDIHPEVRAAMRQAGIKISEPEKYEDDDAGGTEKKRWWKLL